MIFGENIVIVNRVVLASFHFKNPMTKSLASRLVFSCAILLCTFFQQTATFAQHGKSTGRFSRDGVISAITDGNITVTHDDGRQIDYSTNGLTDGQGGNVIVKGRLPMSFVGPGMVLTASVRMSPGGRVQEPVNEVTFVNDQTEELDLDRTDQQGVFKIVGKVIRMTGRGMLLKVPKSRMSKYGRVELTTTDDTMVVFDMRTLDRVNA